MDLFVCVYMLPGLSMRKVPLIRITAVTVAKDAALNIVCNDSERGIIKQSLFPLTSKVFLNKILVIKNSQFVLTMGPYFKAKREKAQVVYIFLLTSWVQIGNILYTLSLRLRFYKQELSKNGANSDFKTSAIHILSSKMMISSADIKFRLNLNSFNI